MGDLSVTSKGQVTIPRDVRQKLGIRAGSKVRFRVAGDHAELTRVSAPASVTASGYGLLKSKRRSVPADFDAAGLLSRK
ncbi:MAG: AbrB/MazE/SpoVT family DNA-binding domain-containing protein [Xanthomonadaceae bacterium]|nr:AbrB/MazE/SpoVT family DNA-binding domain-containing protein [Xanthomonadaceae bacterium]